jgi:hypothetical protein
MYVGNTVTTAQALSRGRNLKITTNFKAGAAASNPSLLNSEETAVGNLKLRTRRIAGIWPCKPLYSGLEQGGVAYIVASF